MLGARPLAGLAMLGLVAVAAGAGAGRALGTQSGGNQVPAALKECGACHMVYPPQFMPRRSWLALLGKLDDHFGEIATLPEAKSAEIAAFLEANAADGPETTGGRRFLRGVPADATPLRITEMPWWIGAHEEVNLAGIRSTSVKTASNCQGCHLGGGASED